MTSPATGPRRTDPGRVGACEVVAVGRFRREVMVRSPLDPLAHRRSALAVCRQGARASVAVPPGARLSGVGR